MTASSTAAPADDSIHLQQLVLGQQHQAAGRIDDAIAAFRLGIDAAGRDGANPQAMAARAELHAKLGNAYMMRGDLGLAGASYTAALRIAPQMSTCWCNLANIQLQSGHPQDAIALYLQAIKLNPKHWASRSNLVQALMATGQMVIAKALLAELADERPQDAQVQHQLGKASFELNEVDAALVHFSQAVQLNPKDADSLYWIGGIQQRRGNNKAAKIAYAAAAQIQPLIRRRAIKSPPDFRVLALYAPFGGNTPTEYLFKHVRYDTDTLALFENTRPDIAALGTFDLVVNLISDADQADAVLPVAADLVKRLGKPVINDPEKIRRTTRDEIADLLPGIAGCRIPKILRLKADSDVSVAALEMQLPFGFPLLARVAGTHGGDDFEKFDDIGALSVFLGAHQHDHYLIEYIDYLSADNYFRKYRFIFAGQEILPYHLAIGTDWKLHHVSTDMEHHAWMQQEEASFLQHPEAVFSAANYAAMAAIRERVGLDYFGIDCGLDRDGNIVAFEVNASMLVHEHNEAFPYKDPAVRAIKAAFAEMLAGRAGK